MRKTFLRLGAAVYIAFVIALVSVAVRGRVATMDRVARSIEREIKEKVADAVVHRAGNTLQTQMTEDDQKRVVVRFIKKL